MVASGWFVAIPCVCLPRGPCPQPPGHGNPCLRVTSGVPRHSGGLRASPPIPTPCKSSSGETFRLGLEAASDGESTTSLGKLFCWLISFAVNMLGAMRAVIHLRKRDVRGALGEV